MTDWRISTSAEEETRWGIERETGVTPGEQR